MKITESVKEYYGEVLKTKEDLLRSACCPIDAMPARLRPFMANIHEHAVLSDILVSRGSGFVAKHKCKN